ncbi:hypothetical protein ANANG_G00044990 [Anguilla anguilla]|uniref:Uncharacterized protein n=1 Tax=Anguilla anguilla TaxID=7936 RepID=A0A9D3MWJ7_ANGAN|nr:hypothetical protein ANANG_G00044990 [Anguilla anguilla]
MVGLRNSVFGIVVVYRLLMKLKQRVSVFNSHFGCSSTECLSLVISARRRADH